ncbi:hypothetical protein TNCV_850481 [Trichonephila clavipes]|uniref:Uncharacterized protein n=1 Tax=Trichonephila clavipes TaxID=2585209 RepID=A0A8X6RYV6_TRICX|nr:hypothetical protein TNCV_850481 [Trichonephila clavipes]
MGDRSATHKLYIRREQTGDLKETGRRVGRNQATVMCICHSWMQEETVDRRGRSHLLRRTTVRDDRRIVLMAVMDRAATPRTIA